MEKLRKLSAIFRRKVKSPEYTRWQWIQKAVTLYLCAVGQDMAGAKLKWYDDKVLLRPWTASTVYGPYYAYLCAIQGMLLALALWKLFEMYWWGKDHVEMLHSNVVKVDL